MTRDGLALIIGPLLGLLVLGALLGGMPLAELGFTFVLAGLPLGYVGARIVAGARTRPPHGVEERIDGTRMLRAMAGGLIGLAVNPFILVSVLMAFFNAEPWRDASRALEAIVQGLTLVGIGSAHGLLYLLVEPLLERWF